ncbi:MAG: hypothetical protein Q8P42_06200 [Gallionella sp.]|nr:hypothetical protein [Gallionella sp.]
MARTSNDDRSDSKNPNNSSYSAAADNHSNQLNPNNSAFWSARVDDSVSVESDSDQSEGWKIVESPRALPIRKEESPPLIVKVDLNNETKEQYRKMLKSIGDAF